MPADELFRNTGLERSERLAKDLEWFASQGHAIPKAGVDGTTYAKYLTELSETDVPAFICHFYNVYFAHSAGGKFIGKKVCVCVHWYCSESWSFAQDVLSLMLMKLNDFFRRCVESLIL